MASRGRFCQASTCSQILSVIWLIRLGETSTPYNSCRVSWISLVETPRAYRPKIFSSNSFVFWPYFGTVETGKRADLILLEANPLEDVGNIRKHAGVMLRGRWLTEEQLQSMLEGLVDSYIPSLVDRLWPLSLIAAAAYMVFRKVRRSSREQSDG